MSMRILKAVRVKVVWNDGSETVEEFSVSDYSYPADKARTCAVKYLKHTEYQSIQIVKVYAALGEKVQLKMNPSK